MIANQEEIMALVYKFARAHQHDTEGAYVMKNQRAPAEAALRAALAHKDTEIAALKKAGQQALDAWQTSCYGDKQHHKAMLLAMTALAQAVQA